MKKEENYNKFKEKKKKNKIWKEKRNNRSK